MSLIFIYTWDWIKLRGIGINSGTTFLWAGGLLDVKLIRMKMFLGTCFQTGLQVHRNEIVYICICMCAIYTDDSMVVLSSAKQVTWRNVGKPWHVPSQWRSIMRWKQEPSWGSFQAIISLVHCVWTRMVWDHKQPHSLSGTPEACHPQVPT